INDRQYVPLRRLREHELCRVPLPRPIGMAQALLHGGQYLMQSYLLVPPQLPEVIPAAVRGDCEQPGPHIGVFRQFAIALIGSEKRVLTEIFGFQRPVCQPPDVEINLSVVLCHELREALVHSTALHALNLCSFWCCSLFPHVSLGRESLAVLGYHAEEVTTGILHDPPGLDRRFPTRP